MKKSKGFVYLIHFERPYRHARHYIGFATDLAERLSLHGSGQGARLMAVIAEAGIPWECVRVWKAGRDFERRLKKRHGAAKVCPQCTPAVFQQFSRRRAT